MAFPAPEAMRAAEKCSLGCPILDGCVGGGGVPCESVTEIVAESGSGKTQLCLQLCLAAQLPRSLGGLSASSIFLHTEFPFPTRRLLQLCPSFRHRSDPSDRVFVRAVHSADQLLDDIPKIESFASASDPAFPLRLVVVDSIAALFRSEFDNTAVDLRRRSALFFRISAELRRVARRFRLAVVVTNQVVDFVGEAGGSNGNGLKIGNLRSLRSSGRRVCPALGLGWSNCVNSRLFLSREEQADGSTTRRLHVLFAPHLPESSAEFVITRDGVLGVERTRT